MTFNMYIATAAWLFLVLGVVQRRNRAVDIGIVKRQEIAPEAGRNQSVADIRPAADMQNAPIRVERRRIGGVAVVQWGESFDHWGILLCRIGKVASLS